MFVFVLLCITPLSVLVFAVIFKRKRKLVALLLLPMYIITINVLWLFLTVPLVGRLQCVIVVFPDHTHLLFTVYI